MLRKKIHIFFLLLSFLIIIPSCLLGYVYYRVTLDAENNIQRGAIDRIIASESPVYYDDDSTLIGVFFDRTHRKYLRYQEIPKVFVKALIAAEDRNFLNHWGFDLKAILRALLANIKAGKVVQGGSTLTQQTAKNVFKREKRSYKAKFKELIQAFLFERRYTKQEILEMYSNQFFVTGYGKGLGIAAQYYFGKDARDLDLVESAFIAGSVKGPNRYNPFIKKSEEEEKEARVLAKLRKNYVLSNMLKMNFITKKQYQETKEMDIPFKEGQITYKLNVILDYIREQLESDYFKAILREQGVDNVAASGISIYTSISRNIQEQAMASLRTHMQVMDVKLNGYNIGQMKEKYEGFLGEGLPFLGRITQVVSDGNNSHIIVTWDQGSGIIDYEGIKPMGEAWLKWKLGDWAVFDKNHVHAFLKNFHIGDLVPVQPIMSPNGNGESKLMLSSIPELDGGIVVLHKGMLKAMVGGIYNRFFNRAVDAKRQLGSIFKPILYTAALQLKWNTLDPLQNMRDIFKFETTSYLPRPDHPPQSQWVSMVWAGAQSENLATVWLLYHLTDHLNTSEFRQVLDLVGLGRGKEESYKSYKERIRDRYGVIVNRKALMEAAFEKSKKDIESDIIFAGHVETLKTLGRMGFNIENSNLNREGLEEQQIQRLSFEEFRELNLRMQRRLNDINSLLKQYVRNRSPELSRELMKSLCHFYSSKGPNQEEKIIYTEKEGLSFSTPLIPFTPEVILEKTTALLSEEVWIDGLLTSDIVGLLQENMKKNYMELLNCKRYDLEVLSWIRDFRTLVNLSYVVYLSKLMGISSRLDPVLSFPLGPNSISIMEAALAYQTIMRSQVYPLGSENDLTMVPIITKITDRDGEILWEYKPGPKRILSDRVSGLITGILKQVMEVGTGRRAVDAVRIFDIPIPSFGKTGTANRFTNSSFVGFIPGPDEKTGQLYTRDGYVIASYVGYDDNRPMKGKHLAIYGASGALPLWIDTANAVVNTHKYKKSLQPADLAFDPGAVNMPGRAQDFKIVLVSPQSGLPADLKAGKLDTPSLPGVLADVENHDESWGLKRRFEPPGGK